VSYLLELWKQNLRFEVPNWVCTVRCINPMTTAVTSRGIRPHSLQNALKLDNPEFVVSNNQISIVVVT